MANPVLPDLPLPILDVDLSDLPISDKHIEFLNKCLLEKSYDQALDFLKVPPWELISPKLGLDKNVDGSKSTMDQMRAVLQIQNFFNLAGQIYFNTGRLAKANECSEYILATPTRGVTTTYMLEAYRRWVLLTCILSQDAPTKNPFGLDKGSTRMVRLCSQEYDYLAKIFASRNHKKFIATIQSGKDLWEKRGHSEIISRLEDAFYARILTEFSRTYSAISISDLAQDLDMPVEQVISQVIARHGMSSRIHRNEDGTDILRMTIADVAALKIAYNGDVDSYIQSAINELTQLKEDVQLVQKRFGIPSSRVLFKPNTSRDANWAQPNLTAAQVDQIGFYTTPPRPAFTIEEVLEPRKGRNPIPVRVNDLFPLAGGDENDKEQIMYD